MRLPAVFTAISNIATGFFAVSKPPYLWHKLALLCGASACLYTAGMVLNDYCDRDKDARERPNRPIPSGRIQPNQALSVFVLLALAGILLGGLVGADSFVVAGLIGTMILLYDAVSRQIILMAFCRFLNVCLGATVVKLALNRQPSLVVCVLLVTLWTLAIMYFSRREVQQPQYQQVVKAMLLGFIVLDAIFVTFLAGPLYGLAVLLLLIPSVLLSRWIYVT